MFDLSVIAGLKKGNPESFREVFRLLYPRLKQYCRLFVPEDEEADDIIQECFLTLWEKRSSLDSGKKIESLLFVMVRNRCFNYLKQRKVEYRNVAPEALSFSELQHLYQIDMIEKEEKTMEEMLMQSFREAVDSLPSKMKTVYIRCKIEGKKQKEVAEELGISIKMVEKQISKAKNQIEKQLRNKYPTFLSIISTLMI